LPNLMPCLTPSTRDFDHSPPSSLSTIHIVPLWTIDPLQRETVKPILDSQLTLLTSPFV